MCILIKPNIIYKNQYKQMISRWNSSGLPLFPWILSVNCDPFDDYLNLIDKIERGILITKENVNFSTYWLIKRNGEVLGASILRHKLSESNEFFGGHIGYGICPEYRNMGYGNKILELTLAEAKKRGIAKVVITCEINNIYSEKIIVKNGGKYDSTIKFSDSLNKKFNIDL